MVAAVPITLHLDSAVIVALTNDTGDLGMSLDAYLTELITRHERPIRGTEIDHADLIASFILLALRVRDEGRFDEDFILTVFRTAVSAPRMRAAYERAIGGDAYAPNLPGKILLNMSLGWHIRNAVGASPKRDATGTELRRRVTGEAIDAYTLLERARLPIIA
ncbi:hypothetical protein DLJ53_23520 [Acuticoccus sediminis]|uniref:Uncharacterized protein n=1 Tax=Acuticoccus sediminis TaxID=2184697 RepID=A0A8B2NIX3_9HYPH|nr:hypothetical protein [Acuticoccus sediminis]RAH99484.1 hypothetical protein DLJ53_23520 [Acuticoccus sediminis]